VAGDGIAVARERDVTFPELRDGVVGLSRAEFPAVLRDLGS